MSKRSHGKLDSPDAVWGMSPPAEVDTFQHRGEIESIIEGTDRRLLIVMGPCSAWPSPAVQEFAEELADFRDEQGLSSLLKIVMRCVIQKPRTRMRGDDWRGPINQPDPLKGPNLVRGRRCCAEMMSKASQLHALGDEALITHNGPVFDPYNSYNWVGARSSDDPEHRQWASMNGAPIGLKNNRYNDLEAAANGVEAIQHPQHIPLGEEHVETSGCKHAHLILRGSRDGPNYDPASVREAAEHLRSRDVVHPAMLVDMSHDNCTNGNGERDPLQQMKVARTVLRHKRAGKPGYEMVRGLMAECFQVRGKRKIEPGMDYSLGQSITDPCMGKEDWKLFLRETADAVDKLLGKAAV